MSDRKRRILEELARRGACTYQQLADVLEVSTMTVRRDVDALAKERRVIKTVGGVQDAGPASTWYETDIRTRMTEHIREKSDIALCALDLVQERQTLFLDGSTTCIQLAQKIADRCKGLTIVTNSVFVCLELGRNRDNVVVSQGGQFDANSGSFVGLSSEEAASRFFVDVAFMSTKGFLPLEGTFESSTSTFRIKRIVASQCARLVLLVDHSKFGLRALTRVLDISQIHDVVTDDRTPDNCLAELRDQNVSVHVAAVRQTKIGEEAYAS
ncbi:MAG: DeoR/GlpR family DNA-binding transcription regulator [Pirellulaceae bacterium]